MSDTRTFTVGQWVYCEFKLGQVRDVEGSAADGYEGVRVTGFSDGCGTLGSWDLSDRCFPLSMDIKRVSDEFDYHYQRIHKEGGSGLNYPDIHRWMVEAWVAACHAGEGNRKPHYEKVQKFTNDVLSAARQDCGYGFALMR